MKLLDYDFRRKLSALLARMTPGARYRLKQNVWKRLTAAGVPPEHPCLIFENGFFIRNQNAWPVARVLGPAQLSRIYFNSGIDIPYSDSYYNKHTLPVVELLLDFNNLEEI